MVELDEAQHGDRVEVVGGADAHLHVAYRLGGPSGLGGEHAPAAEASIVKRGAQRVDVDVVSYPGRCTIVQKHRSQLSEEPHDDGCRVDEVGIDGQSVCRNEPHRVRGPPAHHPHASTVVVSDEAYVAICDEFVEQDPTLFRIDVGSGQPRSMETGPRLLTGHNTCRLVDGGAVQQTPNSLHRRTVTPPRGHDPKPRMGYVAGSTPAPSQNPIAASPWRQRGRSLTASPSTAAAPHQAQYEFNDSQWGR